MRDVHHPPQYALPALNKSVFICKTQFVGRKVMIVMKKGIVLLCSLTLLTSSAAAIPAAAEKNYVYTVEQTGRILQITAEDMIRELQGAGVSQEEITSFFKEVSEQIGAQDSLTEENFDSIMFRTLYQTLQNGSYNNLKIAMISLYSEEMSQMLSTKTVPEVFQPLYQTVKACLLGTGELQVFSDVPEHHWAKSAIEVLAADGIVNGMGNRLFLPDDSVTREQFVKMAADCLGLEPSDAPLPFTDANPSAWYAPSLAAACKAGLISGVSDDLFGVEQPITRQDMAVIVARILEQNQVTVSKTSNAFAAFTDATLVDGYAKEAVRLLSDGGLMAGVGADRFAPLELVTRAQAARMIDQMRQAMNTK